MFAPLGEKVLDHAGKFSPAWASWLQGIVSTGDAARFTSIKFPLGSTITEGTGSPEGAVYASAGSLFIRTDSATDTLYSKTTAVTLNTGWVSK